ncbi:hypothetical protein M8998_01195 [Sphingobacterium sp. lm-10]|uniref:hypothetical protein n=1 Tax=Sphingobacterium sp. lm-10 TaxID=2944904 RepID=UPI002021DA39|nr:hypothetical protein [Sphingobacterium sp. lm-10]MCL7986546.1 hypothetical protein [Sphingobacterium sp. lm-10]
MKKLIYTILGLSAFSFMACHSSQERADENELTPVEPADQQRYNINQSTEEVINLDTTSTDTTQIRR